ncbi:MAG TPA: cation diffusion facilitator family transporter [Acidiferrobacterales bacterium]
MTEITPQAIFDTTDPKRYRASRRVTFASMGVNLLLTAAQIAIGIVGHSQALVADGFHTLADLISDVMVMFAIRHSAKAADEEHPYGHARIETAMTVVLGAMLVLVGAGIALRAGLRLSGDEPLLTPTLPTLIAAALTILAKEGLYQYTVRTARRYGSELLRANAWHHRSDAISSVIVFVGIGGSILGLAYMDALAAIGVALFIAKIGIELGWGGMKELIDTGLEHDKLARIRSAILDVDGVKALHLLRTRRVGGQALVDVHIIVDDRISVSEGHHISEAVRRRLIEEIDEVADVMVHIDPEDDTVKAPSEALPARREIERRLKDYLAGIPAACKVERMQLHYIDGRLHVELIIPLSCVGSAGEAAHLAERLREAVAGAHDPDIAVVRVYYH